MVELYRVSWFVRRPGSPYMATFGKRVPGHLRAREDAFEAIRSRDFPDLPSRLTSVFLFDALDEAYSYARSDPHAPWRIYRVSPIIGSSLFRGDIGWVAAGQLGDLTLDDAATGYWSAAPLPGDQPPSWDVLCSLPVIVVELIDERPP